MKTVQLDDFIRFKFIGALKAAPNHKRLAFIQSQADKEKNTYVHTLYSFDKDGLKKLRFLKENSNYIFLDQNNVLLDYQKNKEERQNLKEQARKQFYNYNIEKKTLSKAFVLPINGQVEAVIDRNTLLVSAPLSPEDHILYSNQEENRKAYLKEKQASMPYEDIDALPYYLNGPGFQTHIYKQLFIYDMDQDKLRPICDKTFSVKTFTLSNDKKMIYFTGNEKEKVMTHTHKIYQYDINRLQLRCIYDKKDYHIHALIDMGQLLVVAKDMTSYGLNQNPDFFLLDGGNLKLIKRFGQTFGNSIGTDCRLLSNKSYLVKDKALYFITTTDDHSQILRLTLDGHLDMVLDFDGSIDGLVTMDDKIYMIAMRGQSLQEIYYLDHLGIKQVSHFNKAIFEDTYVAKPHLIEIEKDTHTIKGFVLLPNNYHVDKTYPMILDIHGGPKTVYGQIYYHEMQYWVHKGYIVAFANPRGSDGKGDEFADIRGKYGTIDYDDLMDFTDQVIHKYSNIDTNKVFVTGGSYGGFMTNWIVGHTDRFRAAVTQRSISNWISFYGTSDIGYYFASDQTDGHPVLDMNKLYDQSPIKYAMQVNTPLLFIHSDKDLRCPMEQAQQFYAILKTKGLDTELKWFKEETHELSRSGKPNARIKRLEDITQWFERYR